MIDWYHLFMLAVFLLWLGAAPPDRNALRIVLVATVASWLIVDFGTSRLSGAWKLSVPGAVETATILCLLRWARNRAGWCQIACLCAAWLAHVLCFADLQLGSDFVYSRYEGFLAFVAAVQIAFFHDTYLHHFRRLGHWWSVVSTSRTGAVPASSVSAPVFHRPGHPGV